MPTAPAIIPTAPKHTPPPRGTTTARGYGHEHRKQRAILMEMFPICQRCSEAWANDLHHIDHNPRNRDVSNLLCVCRKCHRELHGKS